MMPLLLTLSSNSSVPSVEVLELLGFFFLLLLSWLFTLLIMPWFVGQSDCLNWS